MALSSRTKDRIGAWLEGQGSSLLTDCLSYDRLVDKLLSDEPVSAPDSGLETEISGALTRTNKALDAGVLPGSGGAVVSQLLWELQSICGAGTSLHAKRLERRLAVLEAVHAHLLDSQFEENDSKAREAESQTNEVPDEFDTQEAKRPPQYVASHQVGPAMSQPSFIFYCMFPH